MMSVRKTTTEQAKATLLSQCRQHVEDTPWDEPGHAWDQRTEHLAKFLDNLLGTDISAKAMSDLRELITTLEELDSVDAGTHPDIQLNESRTIDNRPDLRDRLNQTLTDNVTEVLSVAAFKPLMPWEQAAA